MKPIFLNMRTSQGVETVDEFTRDENQTIKEFKVYVNQMIKEYQIAGMNVYRSVRSTSEWRKQ